MRALILILSVLVVALAGLIVVRVHGRATQARQEGPLFYVGTLLADARPGEEAVYREATSLRLQAYRVEKGPPPSAFAPPHKLIRRLLRDRSGQPIGGASASILYKHRLTEHGWFPLTAPEVPDALDRVWIVRSIRRDTLTLNRKERICWRVDLIDPALPEDADTVVAWLDEKTPVFGLLKWKRRGETWELVDSKGG